MTIEVRQLSKRFGHVVAAEDVSIRVEQGSLTALLGPSGSGKTTVLRMIAGLEIQDRGAVEIGGRDVTHVGPQKRNVGFVFQQYALFKHMRVGENIAFPLKVRRWKRSAIRERTAELLALLRIEGLEGRYPDQISGGQRQRVALARALAAHPSVLLLDEPFSALDARVRDELREWLRALHDRLHVTSLFVTHDQTEAMELADRIVVMRDGRIEQEGTPAELLAAPASPFVMGFLGRTNLLQGEASRGVARFQGLRVPHGADDGAVAPVVGLFRPGEVVVSTGAAGHDLAARVTRVVPTVSNVRVALVTDCGSSIEADLDHQRASELQLASGDRVYIAPERVHVFARPQP